MTNLITTNIKVINFGGNVINILGFVDINSTVLFFCGFGIDNFGVADLRYESLKMQFLKH